MTMGVLSCIETVSNSPLLPVEVLQQLRKSVLPLTKSSWQDDYQIDPAQPFQGTISHNAFKLSRISTSRVRSRKPLTVTGWVHAAPDGTGSIVRLRYYQTSMLWVIAGLSVMAASLCTAAVLQDLRTAGQANPLWVIYGTLPICGVIAQYYQVKNEMAVTHPLLTKLLQLQPAVI